MTGRLPLHDARSVPTGSRLDYDVCIVGSSVAGVTTALSLARSGLRIAVLEAGGSARDDATSELLDMDLSGRQIRLDSRERWLGGTSNAWTGGLTTLCDGDLAPRPWVPGSGWPISSGRLRELYERAARLLDRPGPERFEHPGPAADGLVIGGDDLRTVAFHIDREPLRFGDLLRTRLDTADGVDAFVLANATEILLDEGGTRVDGVAVATLTGSSFVVGARVVVLACGAIENARLMLASRSRRPAGLGNGRGLVGRFFQDHPKGYTGTITIDPGAVRLPASPYWGRRTPNGRERWGVAMSDAAQQRHGALNSYVRLEPSLRESEPSGVMTLRQLRRGRLRGLGRPALAALISDRAEVASLVRSRGRNRGPIHVMAVRSFLEQEPRSDSRVRLSERLDRFGSPLPAVDWCLSDLDRHSVRVLHDLLGAEVARLGLGKLACELADDSPVWDALVDAAHHAGTTRMGRDAATSVTDPHGKVHELDGLFVSGASLFPTSGFANPVFTIAAVALHVADQVAAELGTPSIPAPGRRRSRLPTPAGRDEVRRWVGTRRRARRLRPSLSRGVGVVWTRPETAELLTLEVEQPHEGEVSVLIEASAVSPGTERARWLDEPGAQVRFPHHPGYSASGTVVRVGAGVYDLEPGTPVAVWGAPHRSLVTVGRRQVHPLPDQAHLEEASLVTLGAIAALGVARAGPVDARSVAVIGSGAIGLLAQRMAAAEGAKRSIVVAASSAKESIAAGSAGVELCHPADIDSVGADVVIEATGHRNGLELAVRAAGAGATVVLLGTTRAAQVAVPLHLVQQSGVRIVGAHMGILERGAIEGLDRRRVAEIFLGHWADGAVSVSDLITDRVDPRGISGFYHRLATDRTMVVPVVQWWRLPDELRHHRGPIDVPDPFRRGLSAPVVGARCPQTAVVDHPPPPPWSPIHVGVSPRSIDERAVALLAVIDDLDPRRRIEIDGDDALGETLRRHPRARTSDDACSKGAVVIDTCGTSESIGRVSARLGPRDLLIVSRSRDTVDLDVQRLVHRTGVSLVVA